MINFPTRVVDNFMPNPQDLIDYSKTLSWGKSPVGAWPGERSDDLIHADPQFISHFIYRVLMLYYTQSEIETDMRITTEAYFQRISGDWDHGWIHSDHPHLLSIILYLTPNANPRSGTSLYRVKDWTKSLGDENVKKNYYLGKLSKEQQIPVREKHNENFIEDTRISNVYNRLLCFDSQLWHGVNSFDTGTEERLTLVCFLKSLSCSGTPINRSKRLSLFRNE